MLTSGYFQTLNASLPPLALVEHKRRDLDCGDIPQGNIAKLYAITLP
jgi:hypothetical protein